MSQNEAGRPTGRTGIKADKNLTNAGKIIYTLKGRGNTLSSAESMTAGGFGNAVTRVPGSSFVYKGGVVVYSRDAKKLLLNLPDELLDTGLVTPAITLAMAEKVLELFGTDYAVAVTGNAGPLSNDKSAGVGRVYWVVVDKNGRNVLDDYDIFGNRDAVREKAVTHGLRLLRNFIESAEL